MLERDIIGGTMSARIERSLGMRIVAGEFAPGHSLPVEGDLCQVYGVSRTVIREAVKGLVGKRLVDVSPRVGTRVLPFHDWNLLDRDVLAWRLTAQSDGKILQDIFEMRLSIEPRCAFLAARDGLAEDHAAIRRHCEDLAAAHAEKLQPLDCAEAALAFHLGVINASRNGLFITIGSAVKSALRLSFDSPRGEPIDPAEDIGLHEEVAAAISARAAAAAAAAMDRLLLRWQRRYLPAESRRGEVISRSEGQSDWF